MNMKKFIRFICAWIAAPVVLIMVIPFFALMDYLFDGEDAPKEVFFGWLAWATLREA